MNNVKDVKDVKDIKNKIKDCEKCKKAFCDRCDQGIGTLRDSCKRCNEIRCDEESVKSVNNKENVCLPENGYRMISSTIAIGNIASSTSLFDVIVDLNYPSNGAKEDMIDILTTKEGKMFFLVGMNVKDHIIDRRTGKGIKDALEYNGEVMYQVLVSLIPMLLSVYHQHPSYRFLFKCFGGLHRSLTVATAFYCKTTGVSLGDAYTTIDSVMKPLVSIKDKNIGTYYKVLEDFFRLR